MKTKYKTITRVLSSLFILGAVLLYAANSMGQACNKPPQKFFIYAPYGTIMSQYSAQNLLKSNLLHGVEVKTRDVNITGKNMVEFGVQAPIELGNQVRLSLVLIANGQIKNCTINAVVANSCEFSAQYFNDPDCEKKLIVRDLRRHN